ncbi:MAG: HAD family phosphatase [Cyclobacteriaceae bacterium]|nr:HAD family phosphatase [Cyclobacteriaceae bacterium]
MNKISTVIFDMDGVLVNSEPVHQRLEKEMYEELGLNLTYEEQQSFVGMSAMDSWMFVVTKYKLLHKPEELLVKGREKYLKVLLDTDEVKLMEGAWDLIDRLENFYHLLLASSATSVTINEVLGKFNLRDKFPLYIGGDMVNASKPNPEIFLKIAEQAAVDPGECVVIEDARHGVSAAKSAGMMAIGFQNHHSGTQNLENADIVVDGLEEITVELIQQL